MSQVILKRKAQAFDRMYAYIKENRSEFDHYEVDTLYKDLLELAIEAFSEDAAEVVQVKEVEDVPDVEPTYNYDISFNLPASAFGSIGDDLLIKPKRDAIDVMSVKTMEEFKLFPYDIADGYYWVLYGEDEVDLGDEYLEKLKDKIFSYSQLPVKLRIISEEKFEEIFNLFLDKEQD